VTSKLRKKTDKDEITITDSTGKKIVLSERLDRVVVLNPPAAEVLRTLQIPEKSIVGVADSIQKSPYLGFGSIESVGSSSTPNIEKIVELKPEAVITQENGYRDWTNSVQSLSRLV
jgi:iron complex transport system substrate-binding protein